MSARHEHDQHFDRFTAPGKLKPLGQRRSERPTTTFPGWADVYGMIELATANDVKADELVHVHRSLLKGVYDAWFDVAAGRGRKKLSKLTRQYTENKKSKLYNPALLDELAPYTTMIRDSFPSTKTTRRAGR